MYKDERIYEIFSKYGNWQHNLNKQEYIELDKKQREDNSIKEYKDKQGRLHRENDLPAVVVDKKNKKYEKWYKHGFLHRENDLPAVVNLNGIEEWWYEGKKHRENDKPAVVDTDKNIRVEEWWYEGKRHRENDLPAVIKTYKSKIYKEEWWYENKRHRENYEPAVIERDEGIKKFFYKGKKQEDAGMYFGIFKKLKKEYPNVPYKLDIDASYYKYNKILGIETLDENGKYYHSYEDAPSKITYIGKYEKEELVFEWHKYGRRHRENDMPAVISDKGNKEWWQNGELFREGDKPVIVGGHVVDERLTEKKDYVRKNGKFNI